MCVCWVYKKTSALQGQKFQVRHGWKIVIRVSALHGKTGKVWYLIDEETATVNTITTTPIQFLFNQSSLFFCRSLQVRPCSQRLKEDLLVIASGNFSLQTRRPSYHLTNDVTALRKLIVQVNAGKRNKKQQQKCQKLNRKVGELKIPDNTRFLLHHVHCCMVRGRQ